MDDMYGSHDLVDGAVYWRARGDVVAVAVSGLFNWRRSRRARHRRSSGRRTSLGAGRQQIGVT